MELSVVLAVGSFSVGVATGIALIIERLSRARMIYIRGQRIKTGALTREIAESVVNEEVFEVIDKEHYSLALVFPEQ